MNETTHVSAQVMAEPATAAAPARDRPEVALAGAVAMLAAIVVVLFFAPVASDEILNVLAAVAIAAASYFATVRVAREIDRLVRR